jgi:hypothetical protein
MGRITLDEMHEYIKLWYHDEQWTDFNMAWDSGYTDLALYLISSAGAIDSKNCYEDAKPVERAIERRLKKYIRKMQAKDSAECFDNAVVYVHLETNEHAFIKNQNVDYLVNDTEMRRWGYVPIKEYEKIQNSPQVLQQNAETN